MRFLGNYIVRGRMQAIGVLSFLTLIAVLLPPFAYLLSGVPVVLLSLRRGPLAGLEIMLGGLLVIAAFSVLAHLDYLLVIVFALIIWVPVYICAIVLRQTESQGMMVLAAGGQGLLFVLLMYFILGDVSTWWQGWLDVWFAENLSAEISAEYQKILAAAIPMMNALIAAGLVLSLVTATLLGRWWQAHLFNPGGFRAEFYRLSLPRWLVLPTMLAIAALFVVDETVAPVIRDGLFIAVFLYLFQGIASVHRIVDARAMSHLWLVFMYGLLFIIPQMALFLACIGMADAWRGRGEKGGNNPS